MSESSATAWQDALHHFRNVNGLPGNHFLGVMVETVYQVLSLNFSFVCCVKVTHYESSVYLKILEIFRAQVLLILEYSIQPMSTSNTWKIVFSPQVLLILGRY